MIESIINWVKEGFNKKMKKEQKNEELETLNTKVAKDFTYFLKDSLAFIGAEVFKQFLLQFEVNEPFIEHNDKKFYFKFASSKKFTTLFGEIQLNRSIYQAKDGETYIPLDSKWGMSKQFTTPDVHEIVALCLANTTQKESKFILDKATFFSVSEKTIRSIAELIGDFAEKNQDFVLSEIHKEEEKLFKEKKADVLVGSLDGVAVSVRDKGAEEEEKKFLLEEEVKKKYSKKMAMVSSISRYRLIENKSRIEKQKLSSSYQASMPEEGWESQKAKFEVEMEHFEKMEKGAIKIILMDGQRSLWNYVNSKEEFEDHYKLLDFYHTCEHLNKAGEALFKEEWEVKGFYRKWRMRLKKEEEAVSNLLDEIEKLKEKLELSKTRLELLKVEETFFRNNSKLMNYKSFLEKGWPIGSGPVEAACKTIVKTRMCRSGMKWEIDTGQNILHLRALFKSERWNSFWNSYSSFSLFS